MRFLRPSALLMWAVTFFAATLLGWLLTSDRSSARSSRRTKSQVSTSAPTNETSPVAAATADSAIAVTKDSEEAHRARPGRRSGRKFTAALLVGALLSVAAIAPVLAADEVTSCTPDTCTIEDSTEDANHEEYWETRFNMDCTKVENKDTPVHLATGVAVLIIKAGNSNAIWQPAPAGDYSTDKETSHWFYCGEEEVVEDDVIDPRGSILGPCSDPAYYAVFDNSLSTVAIKFRFRWYTNYGMHATVKTVPAGMIYTTWQHWAKPNTYVSVFYKDPNTGVWTKLARKLTVRGNWPVCLYTPGWSSAS